MINLHGLPYTIFTNRLYRVADDVRGKIVIADRELCDGHCEHPLTITMPNKFNGNKFVVGYGTHRTSNFDMNADFAADSIEKAIDKCVAWADENVVRDFSDETSEYHSLSWFEEHE